MKQYTCVLALRADDSLLVASIRAEGESPAEAEENAFQTAREEYPDETMEIAESLIFAGHHLPVETTSPDPRDGPLPEVSEASSARFAALTGEPGYEAEGEWALVQGFLAGQPANFVCLMQQPKTSEDMATFYPMYIEMNEHLLEQIEGPSDAIPVGSNPTTH